MTTQDIFMYLTICVLAIDVSGNTIRPLGPTQHHLYVLLLSATHTATEVHITLTSVARRTRYLAGPRLHTFRTPPPPFTFLPLFISFLLLLPLFPLPPL